MEIWWRRAAISAWRAVWVRNVEAKSVNSAMKTGLILTLDDLINWLTAVFSARMRFSAITASREGPSGYGRALGVQQTEITITYRFSEPNEPAALVLPR